MNLSLGSSLFMRFSKTVKPKFISTFANIRHTPQTSTFFGYRYASCGGGSQGREQCSIQKMPKCSKENLENSDCMKKKRENSESPFKSMWYNPECCVEICVDAVPRFDELYYKISDKANRKYTQTWIECPKQVIVPKKVCVFDKLGLPPMERRDLKRKPMTACPMSGGECPKIKTDPKCPKITSLGCKKSRLPPICVRQRSKRNCKKVCTPYPSFSECSKCHIKPIPPVECFCLGNVRLCDMWEYMRKMDRIKS